MWACHETTHKVPFLLESGSEHSGGVSEGVGGDTSELQTHKVKTFRTITWMDHADQIIRNKFPRASERPNGMSCYGPGPLDAPARAPVTPLLTLARAASPESSVPTAPTETVIFSKEREDAFSFMGSGQWSIDAPPSLNLFTLVQAACPESSIPPTLTEISTSPTKPILIIFRAHVFYADCASDDCDFTSDKDNKKPFDFTGWMLNDSSTDNTGVSESHDAMHSDDKGFCHRMSLPAEGPSVDIVRERPGNPLAPSRNSGLPDDQLNRGLRFGGSPMPFQCSDDNCRDGVSEGPFTLSNIIPSHSQQSHSGSGGSLVKEDNSVLTPMTQADTVPPAASEVAVPRVQPLVWLNAFVQGIVENLPRNSATTQVSDAPQTRTSFAGFDSFDKVRHGFEFAPHTPAFCPPPSVSPAITTSTT